MPNYSLTSKGNVTRCPWNCKINHEHYIGTFDGALKWFGIINGDGNEINNDLSPKSWGKLINIVIYHQTSKQTVPKLSNELFNILVNAQSNHKYWAAPSEREANALDVIDKANKLGLICDDKLIKTLKNSDKISSKNRLWAYDFWMKSF